MTTNAGQPTDTGELHHDDGAPAKAVLHYIFDPLCGWCYAAGPLIEAARGVQGLDIVVHGGGMLAGPNRRTITPDWADHVIPHDRRIAQMTGQPFGDAYYNGLLRDTRVVLDSEPPITAILAAEALAGRGLDMLRREQRAYYVEGRCISERAVLSELAADLGFDPQAFDAQFDACAGTPTLDHIKLSRRMLSAVGGHGFPTFALQSPDDTVEPLEIGTLLGKPDQWKAALEARIAMHR
jgi:putative protein-disulfide isomerase